VLHIGPVRRRIAAARVAHFHLARITRLVTKFSRFFAYQQRADLFLFANPICEIDPALYNICLYLRITIVITIVEDAVSSSLCPDVRMGFMSLHLIKWQLFIKSSVLYSP